ncbi:MAG: hypothetical protein FWD69_07730 [Polyangiaceae bacterium]|nr:hypothetical protein [Polyangiaceae bacterium]
MTKPTFLISNHAVGASLFIFGLTTGCQTTAGVTDDVPGSESLSAPASTAADAGVIADDAGGTTNPTNTSQGSLSSDAGPSDAGSSGTDVVGATSAARGLAEKLGVPARFVVGLGNDAETYDPNDVTAYKLGTKLDIHYMYLSGLDWPTWNSPAGQYVTMHANAAKAHGVIPMFTLYQAAAYGDGNLGSLLDSTFMTRYWSGVRTMFQRLGEFGSVAIVHLEPDLWGYAEQHGGDSPTAVPALVASLVPECVDLPNNIAGLARCTIRLGRKLSPKVLMGLSASLFGAYTNNVSDPVRIAKYLVDIGATDADLMVVETLDRDAGCFEKATDPNCQRSGTFYWDEANVQHPNFHDHLAWAKAIHDGTGLPLLWWQMPLGVPSTKPGGTAGAYRDNRVHYLFTHPDEFVAAGGIGAVFGTGAGNQTTATSDGSQFKNAITKYFASTTALL